MALAFWLSQNKLLFIQPHLWNVVPGTKAWSLLMSSPSKWSNPTKVRISENLYLLFFQQFWAPVQNNIHNVLFIHIYSPIHFKWENEYKRKSLPNYNMIKRQKKNYQSFVKYYNRKFEIKLFMIRLRTCFYFLINCIE